MKHLFLISLLFFLPITASHDMPADFDTSMQTERYRSYINFESGWRILDFFRQLYNSNSHARSRISQEIPPIIHHIWLGRPMPEDYQNFRKSWFAHHPVWTCILWADNPANFGDAYVIGSWDELLSVLQSFDRLRMSGSLVMDVRSLDFSNRCYFDASDNYGERSDILRYEILYRIGGVYVDCDVECVKPLDDLTKKYHFYIGIQPLDTHMVQLGIGLIGSIPQHPIVRHAIETIKDDQDKPQIIVRTGPIHFTKSFLKMAGRGDQIDVALPASYFYPCGYEEQKEPRSMWLKPETYAIHWWAGSWMKPEAFVRSK